MGERYRVIKVDGRGFTLNSPIEWDVWEYDDDGQRDRLITSYAFEHQAKEVAAALNKWATAEI